MRKYRWLVLSALIIFFAVYCFTDALCIGKRTYSQIMAFDTGRVIFYGLLLLTAGSFALWNRQFMGIALLGVVIFRAQEELVVVHNTAAIMLYVCIFLDILLSKDWLFGAVIFVIGAVHGLLFFVTEYNSHNAVLTCELLGTLCAGVHYFKIGVKAYKNGL